MFNKMGEKLEAIYLIIDKFATNLKTEIEHMYKEIVPQNSNNDLKVPSNIKDEIIKLKYEMKAEDDLEEKFANWIYTCFLCRGDRQHNYWCPSLKHAIQSNPLKPYTMKFSCGHCGHGRNSSDYVMCHASDCWWNLNYGHCSCRNSDMSHSPDCQYQWKLKHKP